MLKKKIWASFQRIIELFTQQICHKALKNMGMGSRIRKNLFWIPDPGPGVKKAPDPGSGSNIVKNIFIKVTWADRESGLVLVWATQSSYLSTRPPPPPKDPRSWDSLGWGLGPYPPPR